MNSQEIEENYEDEFSLKKEGKFDQLKLIGNDFVITDDQLEQFLTINFDHLGLKRGENQDEDVSLISWYAMKRFIYAIKLFDDLNMISLDKPVTLSYIENIVNENSKRISLTPTGFKGKLYPPQASLIKRMLDIESSPILFVMPPKNVDGIISTSNITFHGGLVNERLSFGKTYCLPALICERLIPYESINTNLIRTNLVICGTKVAKEWKNNLKNYTSLDFQVIETAAHLNNLETLVNNANTQKTCSSAKFHYPEVIVVKDGDITWKGKKAKAIEHTLELFKDKTFSRVIYDDYDMIKLQPNSNVPDALFTWFVSGTDSDITPRINYYHFNNGEKREMPLSSAKPILDAVASVKCNREYSIVEYNIPQIDRFDVFSKDIESKAKVEESNIIELIQKIVNNETVDCEKNTHNDKSLFTGTNDVPYIYNKTTMKILVTIEDKQEQVKIINILNDIGIKAVKLTRANVDKFAREDATVCVAGNLFGVNMGFLTHIIINAKDFTDSSCTQIIGRGQRLSRKQNLQVYFYHEDNICEENIERQLRSEFIDEKVD